MEEDSQPVAAVPRGYLSRPLRLPSNLIHRINTNPSSNLLEQTPPQHINHIMTNSSAPKIKKASTVALPRARRTAPTPNMLIPPLCGGAARRSAKGAKAEKGRKQKT